MPLKIGMTGGIGSGKSTVCRIFELLGIPVYYADDRAKMLMNENPDVRNQITALIGPEAYNEHGQLDREVLAAQIFQNPAVRLKINEIVHPAVHRDFAKWAESKTDAPYVLEEAALIFESGGDAHMDFMITVIAPLEKRINWVMKRNGLDRKSVMDRINAQWSDEKKIPLSDFIIVNDLQSSLIRQVNEIHNFLINENV